MLVFLQRAGYRCEPVLNTLRKPSLSCRLKTSVSPTVLPGVNGVQVSHMAKQGGTAGTVLVLYFGMRTFLFAILYSGSSKNGVFILKQLLELLERDAKRPISELAAMLGKSRQEVADEIKALEEEKIIIKYHTIVNWEKAGTHTVTALIEVKITPQREVGFDAIAERIYRFPEVRSVYLMSGAYDLLVMLEGHSLKEIASFVSTKLSTIDGVIGTTTHFMLKAYKESGIIIEDQEEDRRLVVTP